MCNKKVNTSKNKMGFNPLIKKYKRIRENNTVTNVNASNKAYVSALFAKKTTAINKNTNVSFERGSNL
jgi:hypothetical protein